MPDVEPRPASTLILVRGEPIEVLLLRRNDRGTFASALVFPGGVVEPEDRVGDDDLAHLLAAARETHEETAISVDPDTLHPFARWLTPDGAPRRWHTRFYLAAAPPDAVARPDGNEIVEAQWLTPSGALDAAAGGEIRLVFPTIVNLALLATCTTVDEAIALAKGRPDYLVHPKATRTPEGVRISIPAESGYTILEYFEPAEYV